MKLSHFAFSFVAVPILDFLWIGLLMKPFYLKHLGNIARLKDGGFDPLIWPAVLVYVCLALGISYFVLPRSEDVTAALLNGAVFGLCLYGVYDFTNLSVLKDWSLAAACVDLVWGGFLCGSVSALTKLVLK